MTTLTNHRRAPASGQTKNLIVFLHGYGADGNDLLGLAEPLAEHLPDTVFVSPDAPQPCANNPMGFQWFPIPWLDGSSEEESAKGMTEAIDTLNIWLDETMQAEGVTAANTVVVGFSQGTMMALHVLPRRAEPVAGLVGFSGRLLEPGRLAAEMTCKMPVLLVHGDSDPMVPPSSLPEAANALNAAGFEVYTHLSEGTAHSIAMDGLSMALQFILQKTF